MKLEYLLRVENFPQEVREEIERVIHHGDFFSNHEKSSLNEMISDERHQSRYFLDESDAAKKLKQKLFSKKDIQFLTEKNISLSVGITADYSYSLDLVEISAGFGISISAIDGLNFNGSQVVYHSEKFLLTDTFDIKKNLSFKEKRALFYNKKEEIKEDYRQIELFNKSSSPKSEHQISYPIQYSNVIQLLQILEEIKLLKNSKEFKNNLLLLDYSTTVLPPTNQEQCCFDEKFIQKEIYTRDNFCQLHLFGLFVLHNFSGLISDTLTLLMVVDFISKVARNILEDKLNCLTVDIYCNHVAGDCEKVSVDSFYRQFMSLIQQLNKKDLRGFLDEVTDYYSILNNKFVKENKKQTEEDEKFEEDFRSLVESGVEFFSKVEKTPDIRSLPRFHTQLLELIDKCAAKQHLSEQKKEKIADQIYFSLVIRRQHPPFSPFWGGGHRYRCGWDVSHLEI